MQTSVLLFSIRLAFLSVGVGCLLGSSPRGLAAFHPQEKQEKKQETKEQKDKERPRQDEGIQFFREKIEPVLKKHCYRCHSGGADDLKGGLRLDFAEGIREGGDSGPAIVPKEPDESLLIQALRYDDDFYQMPPSQQLPEKVVKDFQRWVEMGAPDPRKEPDSYSGEYGYEKSAAAPVRFPEARFETRLRRPTSLAIAPDQRWLVVANQRSGSVQMVDLTQPKVVGEQSIGGEPVWHAFRPGTNQLVVADFGQHQLVVLEQQGMQLSERQRLPVSSHPIYGVYNRLGTRLYLASLWSRRISHIEFDAVGTMRVARTLDLTLAPRQLSLLEDEERLIVADAFGGRLAVIDLTSFTLEREHEFPAHNIRSLRQSPSGEKIVIAHQMLNEFAHTVRNDVHWGLLMSNDLRWLRVDALLGPPAGLHGGSHMHPLGEPGKATADPSGIAISKQGLVVVTLGGVGEVAIGTEDQYSLQRLRVGRRPTDVVIDANDRYAYVANTLGDSITQIDLRKPEPIVELKLGPPMPLSLVDRGELLFYDARLSHDRWMSCHSCHTDGHSNGMINDNFSDRSFGAPKRVLSLLGRQGTEPFAWNGSVPQLEDQIHNSVVHTMQRADPPSEASIKALAAFIRSRTAAPSISRVRGTANPAAIQRGSRLFAELQCDRCHAPPTYTTPHTYDVGLQDQLGNREFNPPTLIGVGQRDAYFHDARHRHLRDVFEKSLHQLPAPLSPTQLNDLLAFLKSLE